MSEQTPAHIALRDAALAETRDDLKKLTDAARHYLIDTEPDQVISDMVQGLLDQPLWDRLELASVLGMAVVRLAEAAADA